MTSAKSSEAKARRLAHRLGMYVTKSPQQISMDNLGDFTLVDASRNFVVGGSRYDWTADDIIEYRRQLEASEK